MYFPTIEGNRPEKRQIYMCDTDTSIWCECGFVQWITHACMEPIDDVLSTVGCSIHARQSLSRWGGTAERGGTPMSPCSPRRSPSLPCMRVRRAIGETVSASTNRLEG